MEKLDSLYKCIGFNDTSVDSNGEFWGKSRACILKDVFEPEKEPIIIDEEKLGFEISHGHTHVMNLHFKPSKFKLILNIRNTDKLELLLRNSRAFGTLKVFELTRSTYYFIPLGKENIIYIPDSTFKLEEIAIDIMPYIDISQSLKVIGGSGLTQCSNMFEGLIGDKLDLSEFDGSNVVNMTHMFSRCEFNKIDLTNFNCNSAINMSYMFSRAKIREIDLTGLDVRPNRYLGGLFFHCEAEVIRVPSLESKYRIARSDRENKMFMGCNAVVDFKDVTIDLSKEHSSSITK